MLAHCMVSDERAEIDRTRRKKRSFSCGRSKLRKETFFELGARPQTPGDLTRSCRPRLMDLGSSLCSGFSEAEDGDHPQPGPAPESALGLRPMTTDRDAEVALSLDKVCIRHGCSQPYPPPRSGVVYRKEKNRCAYGRQKPKKHLIGSSAFIYGADQLVRSEAGSFF